MFKMIKKSSYWPTILKKHKGILKPDFYVPYKYLFLNTKGINAFEKAAKRDAYWVSSDSAFCLNQNKDYLSKLLKDYVIIELGGFDGSALNQVYNYNKNHKFEYINVDIGKGLGILMNRNFKNFKNVKHSIIKSNFDDIGFIKNIKVSKPKAILFLGNTFGNYKIKEGNVWLKKMNRIMNKGDMLILGFDKRVSSTKHLDCYNIPESGYMSMLAAQSFGMPAKKLRSTMIFDEEGIHGGVIALEKFLFKNKTLKKNDFIEVFISLKSSLNDMKKRVSNSGFKLEKILTSNEKHIYHLVLKK
jgi:hypothetical protein